MRHSFLAAGFAILSSFGVAQEEAERTHSPVRAWLSFQQQHAGEWHVRWNKATSTPSAIYGPGLRLDDGPTVDLADARRRADNVLTTQADLLGTGDSQFVEVIGQRVNLTYVFVYDQKFRGLDVISGRADVRVHANGVVSMFGSRAVRIPANLAEQPTVAEGQAQIIAYDHVEAVPGAEATTNRVVIWADTEAKTETAVRLAWEVGIDARPAQTIYGKAYIDALTGQVLQYRSEIYRCEFGHDHVVGEDVDAAHARMDLARSVRRVAPKAKGNAVTGTVMAWVNLNNNGLASASNTPIQGVLVSVAGGQSAFTDVNGNFTIPHPTTNPVTVTVNYGANRSEHVRGGIFDQSTANLSASTTATPGGAPVTLQLGNSTQLPVAQSNCFYYVDDVNRWARGVLGNSAQMNTASNITVFTNINSSCNAFYTGNNDINFYTSGTQGGTSCANTAFKSVIYHEWGHGLDDRYGGISQTDGLSEGWGDICSCYRSDNPLIGEGFANGNPIRTALNTLTYPVPASAGVHTQGQVWMGWAWQVREALIASQGAGQGAAIAELIVLGSVVGDATNQPDAVLEVFLVDDDDGNLNNGVPHYAELSGPAQIRNLPFPELQVGSITHAALASTTEQLKPRVVNVAGTLLQGSFTAMDLVFDDGSGTQTRAMVPDPASAGDYIALLPGKLSPATVTYHIEATHSTGLALRLPESGEFSYSVGNEVELFFDDFEGPELGWTHAQVQTQDDWQRGNPDGDGGDPDSPFGGSTCWANDLGLPGWNGTYRNNVHNWLRSPVINAVGQTGVTLQFQRWLTVEEAIYDQAQVRHSQTGSVLWQNQLNGNTIDDGWVQMNIPVPQLDNSSGQIEWRLISDGGLVFGGWNIDDVRVFSFQALPPPTMQFTATPAQIPATGSTQFDVQGTPNAPAAMLLSLTPGPTSSGLPGLDLEVGSVLFSLPFMLDGSGQFSTSAPGSTDPTLTGTLLYAQVVESSGGTIVGSNGTVILFAN